MTRKDELRRMRTEVYEEVLGILSGTSEEHPVECNIEVDVPGMDEEFCPTIVSTYSDGEDIWVKYEGMGGYDDFNNLYVEQMCDVADELKYYIKR